MTQETTIEVIVFAPLQQPQILSLIFLSIIQVFLHIFEFIHWILQFYILELIYTQF